MSYGEYHYDAVIVGAGISGAIIAKTLALQGKRVLILEAGAAPAQTFAGYREYLERFYTQTIKVPNAPYPNDPHAPAPNVLDVHKIPAGGMSDEGYFVQRGPLPFASDYTRAGGGTTLHWMGTCLRMLPNDFTFQSTYGQGVDWPLTYQDLRPFYERAEREIGVAGDVSEQNYPGIGADYWGNYVFPMEKIPQAYVDQVLSRRIGNLSVPMAGGVTVHPRLESTPQGRNSMPNPRYPSGYQPVGAVGAPYLGQRCEGNSSCVPICPVQAKYNALKTLTSAPADLVELRAQSVASRVVVDPVSRRITSIEYKTYDGSTATATGTVYILAANAIESAKLLLASRTDGMSAGVANNSGQVGRNLMDHPVLLTWGRVNEPLGPFRGPGSTSGISAFRDGAFRRTHASFRTEIGAWGWNWPTGAPFTTVSKMVNPDPQRPSRRTLFGSELRRSLYDAISGQFRIGWEVEQTPDSNNRVTIDDDYRDALGNYRPVIDYDLSDYTKAGMKAAKEAWNAIRDAAQVEDHTYFDPVHDPGYFEYEGEGYTFRGAGHVVGTHRMGSDSSHSVVNSAQRAWDHPNLYLAGCGSMPTLGTSNPTLTMAALAYRTADDILQSL